MSRRFVLLASFAIAAIAAAAPVLGALPVPPWSGENPGMAVDHAQVAGPALEHNQALENHPGSTGEHPGMPDGLPEQANDHAADHVPFGTSARDTDDGDAGDADDGETDDTDDGETDDTDDGETDDADDGETDDTDDGETDDADDEAPTASTITPMHFGGNYSANGTVGSGTWDFSNLTLNVTAGNFSWHGINCSWEAFTWQKGMNLSDVINITCDFWGAFTITIDHGEVTISWSSGSWNHTLGAPIRPVEISPTLEAGSTPVLPLAATRTAETRLASMPLPF